MKKIFGFVIVIAFLLLFHFFRNKDFCKQFEKQLRLEEFHGLVDHKYIDKNHALPKIILLERNKTTTFTSIFPLKRYQVNIYDFVEKGDSVIKTKGDTFVTVIREDKKYMFQLKCKKDTLE